jgi:hypothetical protein
MTHTGTERADSERDRAPPEEGSQRATVGGEVYCSPPALPPHRPLPPLPPRRTPLPVAPRGSGSPVPRVSLRSSSPAVLRPPRAPVPPPLPPKSADAMSRFAVRELHEGGQVRRGHGDGEGGGGVC